MPFRFSSYRPLRRCACFGSAFLFSGIVLLGCGSSEIGEAPKEADEQALEAQADEAKESVSSVRELAVSGGRLEGADDKGRPLWRLEAKEIKSSGEVNEKSGLPSQATLFDAKATLYREGKLESSFVSKQMTLFDTPNGVRLRLTGGVSAQSANLASGGRGAIQITAQRADLDVTKRVVAASGDVKATHGKTTLQSARLRSQTTLESLDLSGGVQVATPESRVRAQSAKFGWKTNRLSAQTVTATHDNMVLTGQKLDADLNTSRGSVSGDVKASAGADKASAARFDFNWKTDQLSASDAVLTREGATLRAGNLQTDANLRVASAQSVTLTRGDATLRAQTARGFDGLSRLSGTRVRISRGEMQIEAASADARNWSQSGGMITASGGVTVKSPRATVRAPKATVHGSSKIVASGGVSVQTPKATLRAASATVFGEDKVVATGGVSVQAGELSAKAPSATWTRSGQSGTIQASGGIEMRGRGATLRAQSGTANTSFSSAALRGDVRATLPDGSTLRAPSLQKNGQLLVAPDATAQFPSQETGTLTLNAKRIEAQFDGSRAVATGGVTLRSPQGATIKAPRAEYLEAKNQIIATGGVSFSDPKRGLTQRGDSLRADLKTGSFVVDNARGQGSGQLFDGAKLFE